MRQTIWNFLNLRHELIPSKVMIVLGSDDLRIARYASSLYHAGTVEKIIFSGGLNQHTKHLFTLSEAVSFAKEARSLGVLDSAIFIEDKSSNTQENLENSMRLMNQINPTFENIILVQKPNMLRRVHATATKLFPGLSFLMSSHPITFEEAPHEYLSLEMLIHELVGDLQRIQLYAEKGFLIPQFIPGEVGKAYDILVQLGYTGHLAT